jgi:hypothetical protein
MEVLSVALASSEGALAELGRFNEANESGLVGHSEEEKVACLSALLAFLGNTSNSEALAAALKAMRILCRERAGLEALEDEKVRGSLSSPSTLLTRNRTFSSFSPSAA